MNRSVEAIDPDGLLEYSVVFSDRSLNHMSKKFQGVMCDLSRELKEAYKADAVAIIPGGGSYGMESVARQFAKEKKVLVLRNGWFSYRWSQIFEQGGFTKEEVVLKASPQGNEKEAPFAPPPIKQVVKSIREEWPSIIFAPHVETSSGIILPNDYLKQMGAAAREVGALFVLDCVASGCLLPDMKTFGVDVLISAPQKGWSSTPSSGLIMMSQRALDALENSTSNSFALDLKKWHSIMQAYELGGHAYHATMPTDSLCHFRDRLLEAKTYGFEKLSKHQWQLGNGVRTLLAEKGVNSVAAKGYEAPGVVVSYTRNPQIQNGEKFKNQGLQIAAGVPLMCGESKEFSSFRIGLFGLDKLYNLDRSLERIKKAFEEIF